MYSPNERAGSCSRRSRIEDARTRVPSGRVTSTPQDERAVERSSRAQLDRPRHLHPTDQTGRAAAGQKSITATNARPSTGALTWLSPGVERWPISPGPTGDGSLSRDRRGARRWRAARRCAPALMQVGEPTGRRPNSTPTRSTRPTRRALCICGRCWQQPALSLLSRGSDRCGRRATRPPGRSPSRRTQDASSRDAKYLPR